MRCRWESLGLDESREQKRWKRRGRCVPSQLFRSLFVIVPLWSLSCLCLCCSIAPSPSFQFSFFLYHNHGFPPSPWLQNSFCKSRDDPELTNILTFSSLLSELPKVQAFWCVCVCARLQAEMLSSSCTFVPGSCFFGLSAQHFSKTAKVHLICLSFPKSGFLLIDFSFFSGPFSSGTQFRGYLPLDVSQLPKLY